MLVAVDRQTGGTRTMNRVGKLVLGGVIVVALLAGGGWWLWSRGALQDTRVRSWLT